MAVHLHGPFTGMLLAGLLSGIELPVDLTGELMCDPVGSCMSADQQVFNCVAVAVGCANGLAVELLVEMNQVQVCGKAAGAVSQGLDE